MDSNLVRKVMTFKSGKFAFSRKYDYQALMPLLIRAEVLHETVEDLPILPSLSAQIEDEIIKRSIFSTAAIEGNPLTEEKVGRIVSSAESHPQTKERAEREIVSLKKAYDFLRKEIRNPDHSYVLSEDIVKAFHSLITSGIAYDDNEPGKYRNHSVKVGDRAHGGVYTPPKIYDDIRTLMGEYINWINSDAVINEKPEIRAALAHFHLASIHPFGQGNGRTARVIEALLLGLAGKKYTAIMLSNYYYRNIDDYYLAFSRSQRNKENNVTPFLEFVLKGVIESMGEIKQKIIYFIRRLSLRDYYQYLRQEKGITARQLELLLLLPDYGNPFTLADLTIVPYFKALYRNASERTARRDLERLTNLGLVRIEQKGIYRLNFEVLG